MTYDSIVWYIRCSNPRRRGLSEFRSGIFKETCCSRIPSTPQFGPWESPELPIGTHTKTLRSNTTRRVDCMRLFARDKIGHESITAKQGARNLVSLVKGSKHLVRIVCGDLAPAIYGNAELREVLGYAISRRGLRVTIATGPDPDEMLCQQLRALGIRLIVLSSRPLIHFAVGDTDLVRYEGHHPAGEPIPANRSLNRAPRTARFLAKQFDEILASCPQHSLATAICSDKDGD